MSTPIRHLGLIIVALIVPGCTSLHTIPGPPRSVMAQVGPRNIVRLTDKRGREVSLADARIEGDSVVGVRSLASEERIALAIADIDVVAIGEFDPIKTGLLFIGVPVALVTFVIILFHVTGGYTGT